METILVGYTSTLKTCTDLLPSFALYCDFSVWGTYFVCFSIVATLKHLSIEEGEENSWESWALLKNKQKIAFVVSLCYLKFRWILHFTLNLFTSSFVLVWKTSNTLNWSKNVHLRRCSCLSLLALLHLFNLGAFRDFCVGPVHAFDVCFFVVTGLLFSSCPWTTFEPLCCLFTWKQCWESVNLMFGYIFPLIWIH